MNSMFHPSRIRELRKAAIIGGLKEARDISDDSFYLAQALIEHINPEFAGAIRDDDSQDWSWRIAAAIVVAGPSSTFIP